MKTRSELAEDLCKAVDKLFSYSHFNENIRLTSVLSSLNAWRNAPPDPPDKEAYGNEIAKELQKAYTRGILTGQQTDKNSELSDEEVWLRTIEAVASGGMWNGVTNIANNILDAFREKFRKESK